MKGQQERGKKKTFKKRKEMREQHVTRVQASPGQEVMHRGKLAAVCFPFHLITTARGGRSGGGLGATSRVQRRRGGSGHPVKHLQVRSKPPLQNSV